MSATPKPTGLKSKKLVAALLIATVLLGVFSYYGWQEVRPRSASKPGGSVGETVKANATLPLKVPIDLGLQVNITDHGKLVSSNNYPHDILNDNFFNFLIGAFMNAQSGQSVAQTLRASTGASWGVHFWTQILYSAGCTANGNTAPPNWTCISPGYGGAIEVGTGAIAAARNDVSLTTAYQSPFFTSTACMAGSTDTVSISGSSNALTGTTLREAGLFYSIYISGQTYFMLAHDTFPGIAVSAGNIITVQYTLSLNSPGLNYNLCNYLAALLTQPNGAYNTVKDPTNLLSYTDTLGRTVGYSVLCAGTYNVGNGFINSLASSSPLSNICAGLTAAQMVNNVQICVGTGISAFTPTSTSLGAQVACNYVTSTSYDSAGNAYITANIIVSPGATISEAALYVTVANTCINFVSTGSGSCGSYGTDTTMWMASTFTGQIVGTGQPIGITFQVAG